MHAGEGLDGMTDCRGGTPAELTDAQFRRWAELVECRTGIRLAHSRKTFLTSTLRGRMRELGHRSYSDYYHLVTQPVSGAAEWAIFVDRLTIHETCFFRHSPSFELVRQFLVERATSAPGASDLHLWSVGCATGEEAYSLAMLVDELEHPTRYYGVTGTDISTTCLGIARRGIYSRDRMTNLNGVQIAEHFTEVERSRYLVSERLRKRVCFARMNVQDIEKAPLGQMDVIFCQNLLIYLEKSARKRLADRLQGFLKAGGLLVLGVGEVLDWCPTALRRVSFPGTLAFQRVTG